MFLSRSKKNNVYPCKAQFYYIKVGFRGSLLYKHVFVMASQGPSKQLQFLRSHSFKLNKRRFRLNVLANVFSNRLVNLWNDLPDNIVNASSVNAFKTYLINIGMGTLTSLNQHVTSQATLPETIVKVRLLEAKSLV